MSRKSRTARGIDRRAPVRDPAPRVVVVAEGAVTEPGYLKEFNHIHGDRSSARLVPIGGVGYPRAVVERAIAESRKSRRDRLGGRDSVWAMFDRDEHPRFDEAKNMADGNDVRLAISNPCFELWAILHYRECDAPIDRHECRKTLEKLHPGYGAGGRKRFDDPKAIESKYRDAVERARKSLTRREEEGDPGGNPSTTVHHLTEHILCLVARSKRKG